LTATRFTPQITETLRSRISDKRSRSTQLFLIAVKCFVNP